MQLTEVKRYWRIYKRSAINRFSFAVSSRSDFLFFFLGKLLRMGFFVLLAISLFTHIKGIAGYSEGQVLTFFAMMNMIDVVSQLFWYRGLYSLKDWIRRGKFDQFIMQPVHPLFKAAAMQTDFIDLLTLPIAIIYLAFAWSRLPVQPSLSMALLAMCLLIISLVLAFAINLCVAALSFWTQETEGAWAIYRDSLYVARFPPEIFPAAARGFFTFVIPVLAVTSFPAKALMGLVTPSMLFVAIGITALWLFIGLSLWRRGIRHYTSAGG